MSYPDAVAIDEIRDAVRRAGNEQIESLAREIDRTQEFSPELWRLLCELGVPSLPFSRENGGINGSYEAYVAATEEIAWYGAVAGVYCGPTVQVASAIMRYGNEYQKSRWGLDLAMSRTMGAWAFTEPQTGQILARLRRALNVQRTDGCSREQRCLSRMRHTPMSHWCLPGLGQIVWAHSLSTPAIPDGNPANQSEC